MKTIVAAIDFSDTTTIVIDTAVQLAHALHAEIVLFHATPPSGITPSGFHRDWLSSPRLSVRIARPRNLLTNRSTSPLPRRCRSLPTIRIFVTGQAFQHQCQCIDNTPMAIIGSMHAAHSSARRFEATLRFDP